MDAALQIGVLVLGVLVVICAIALIPIVFIVWSVGRSMAKDKAADTVKDEEFKTAFQNIYDGQFLISYNNWLSKGYEQARAWRSASRDALTETTSLAKAMTGDSRSSYILEDVVEVEALRRGVELAGLETIEDAIAKLETEANYRVL